MNFTVLSFALVVVSFLLIRFATKILMKLLGFLLLGALIFLVMFYLGWGPFRTNPLSIDTLNEKYCELSEASQEIEYREEKCDCIVKQIDIDLKRRWKPGELEQLKQDRAKIGYAVKLSFDAQKETIMRCLEKRHAADAIKSFQKELLPVEDELVDKFEKWRDQLKNTSQSFIDSVVTAKKEIDQRYN